MYSQLTFAVVLFSSSPSPHLDGRKVADFGVICFIFPFLREFFFFPSFPHAGGGGGFWNMRGYSVVE